MDDFNRNLQKDHAERLRQERFISQTYGVPRSTARRALKQALTDRQFAAERNRPTPAVARPPAPKIETREVKIDLPKPMPVEEVKRQVLPPPPGGQGATLPDPVEGVLIVVDGVLNTADVYMINLVEVL